MPRWTYSITIVNNTDRPLELISSSLPWGQKDGGFPEEIAPGACGKFSVYAKAGTSTGIEMYFSMKDKVPSEGDASYGLISFSLDMPYWKHKNTSKLNCTGVLKSDGFSEVPDGAHDFSTTVQVFTSLSDKMLEKKSIEECGYCNSYDWEMVRELNVMDPDLTPVSEILPKNNILSGRKMIGRTEKRTIPRSLWGQIIDRSYKDDYSKKHFVQEYFTDSIYEVRRNISIPIAANETYEKNIEITNHSTIRRETSEEFRIENTIECEAEPEAFSLSEELSVSYQITNLSEYCAENEKIEKETFSYAADEKDRIVVLWDVVQIIALYRVNCAGKTELVGIGDYLVSETQITYTSGEEGIDLPGVELEHPYVNSEANYEAKDEYAEDNNLSTIQGSITINGTTYRWREYKCGGLNRGIEFNPGRKRYEFDPNPHDDAWYNSNQSRWYAKMAEEFEKKAQTTGWNWPSTVRNLKVRNTTYTATKI